MLIKLTPLQVTDNWEALKFCISASLPPIAEYSDQGMVEIKKQILSGRMQCWALLGEKDNIKVISTTIVSSDIGTGIFNLLIYSLFSLAPVSDLDWEKGFVPLKDFALKNRCKKIIAYSNIPRVIEIVKTLGGKVDYQLISLEVK